MPKSFSKLKILLEKIFLLIIFLSFAMESLILLTCRRMLGI